MSVLHDTIHWIIDHLNVTQEEKDEQHTAIADTVADGAVETEPDASEHENI